MYFTSHYYEMPVSVKQARFSHSTAGINAIDSLKRRVADRRC